MTTTSQTIARPTRETVRSYDRGDRITVAEARARTAKAARMAGFALEAGITSDTLHLLEQPGYRTVLANMVPRGERISDETWTEVTVIVGAILTARSIVAGA